MKNNTMICPLSKVEQQEVKDKAETLQAAKEARAHANKARQAAITNEISEIVGGAAALEA